MVNTRLSIAVPASLVSDVPHLRDKTLKIGLIGRAAAIFGVDQIIVYKDDSSRKWNDEISFISIILSYMETPQYLRRPLFGLRPELRYVGVLPPLRTPHHPLGSKVKDLVRGEFREGVVMTHTRMGNMVDIGVEDLALVRGKKTPIGTRLTVRMKHIQRKHLEAEVADGGQIKAYWGYRVTRSDDQLLGEFLETHHFDLIVATSRRGASYVNVNEALRDKWMVAEKKLLVFGAPSKGLYELLEREGRKLENMTDFVVNFAPCQTVETIRTEEAVLLTLGIINILNATIY